MAYETQLQLDYPLKSTKVCETDIHQEQSTTARQTWLTDGLHAFPLEMQAGERVKNEKTGTSKTNFSFW